MSNEKEITKKMTKQSLPQSVRIAVKSSQAKKGEDIVVLRLSEISSFTDFFIIINGNSGRQNIAIYENIEQELKKLKIKPLSIEGKENAEWILMDYGNFVVHIFSKKAREYYSLEKLWGDAPKISY
ncbi:MAG: ribosome silencing factor [Acidobacteriota bacterium]|nr:ribosome silencing factor [Acidobacteriota bacterium]